MSRPRFTLDALGFCALILGLVAVLAGPAQAEVGAKWAVVNSKGELVEVKSGGLLPTIRLTEVESGEKILSKIVGIKIEKKCKGYELLGAKLEAEGKVSSGAKVRFTECVLLLNGVVSSACTPHTPGQPAGTLESTAANVLLVLHKLEGGTLDPIIRITPSAGETFMTVETGPECAVGEKIPVIGKITMKDSQNELGVEKVTHLVEEGPLTEAWLISKTAEHKLTFDGSATGELSGEHKGLKFSGTPG